MASPPISPVSRLSGPMLGPGMMPMRGVLPPPLSPSPPPFDPLRAGRIVLPTDLDGVPPAGLPDHEYSSLYGTDPSLHHNLNEPNTLHGFSDGQFQQRISGKYSDTNKHIGWYGTEQGRHHYRFHEMHYRSKDYLHDTPAYPDRTRTAAARSHAVRRGHQRDHKAPPLVSDATFDTEPVALHRSYSAGVAQEAGVSVGVAREALLQTGREDRPRAVSMAQKIMRHRTEAVIPGPSARAYSRELAQQQEPALNANLYAVLGTQPEDEVDEPGEEVDEDGFVVV